MIPFFTLLHQDQGSQARIGLLKTDHGPIKTPVFMPVGTLGSVKAVHQRELKDDLAAEIILANTYHLHHAPTTRLLRQAGGLHRFMGWDRPILTDSGGYQVYSLASKRKISEAGVQFFHPKDGSRHFFTPERAIELQRAIGSDIIMAFDECTPPNCDQAYLKASMERTHRWLKRCILHMKKTKPYYGHQQVLFPIIQGGVDRNLRSLSTRITIQAGLAGHAIGGVCHTGGQLYEVTGWVCELLPKEKPRYLMGVGTPQDLLECIALGVDMFDCVMPTRNARNGGLFTTYGRINIKNRCWRDHFHPIDPILGSYASSHHTLAYLYHLFQVKERLGAQIATLHNLAFYHWLIQKAREHIIAGDFTRWKQNLIPTLMNPIQASS